MPQPFDILPTKASYSPTEPVAVELWIPDGGTAALTVWHLGKRVQALEGCTSGVLSLGPLDPGGYGMELESGGKTARTAVEVSADPRARLRYGFVASYAPGKDVQPVAELVRRLHLNGVQFYDWAYRHADLMGGGEEYSDALAQPVSLATVKELVRTVQAAGSRALGYAAVYAAGPGEWDNWEQHALLMPNGEPYALGDFLFLLDPAAQPWLAHFTRELADATSSLGFDGFHLDQYGYPKRAATPDGAMVDVADSFVQLIDGVRDALPASHLVFNNVNDFPTWRTAPAPQDAVYVEVWPPHTTLGSLADVVSRAKAVRRNQPVVIAAYQHVYDSADQQAADRATALTMATLFSHGATQLLAGEGDRVLVDPYYVRNHRVNQETSSLLARWYDFLVEHDELIMDPGICDVTGSYAGAYNDDLDLSYESAAVSDRSEPGAVWRRITRVPGGFAIHLINLLGQSDTEWDAPRAEPQSPGDGRLRVRRTRGTVPRVRYADPDRQSRLVEAPVELEGDYATAILPAPHFWQLVYVTEEPAKVPPTPAP
ncbi:glycoside hydrolase family 66 protein [Arthrobacter sp. FW306-2-2C-D06B]|uniref:glycoside hydrolase family 66 protein n=1 Tax=Arthrobacter sp. FW306-2-2C-D06B TaxID=2879618 RepID=UPI001F42A5B0|nr:glycoside hydrolase family 66 protein [Arthrobacter sp. FW306-2-2C-D06B]UKA59480.1 glycoside hydrolase family 66 protein [Arthrobacter sp. FW306-2-2C-D06B]